MADDLELSLRLTADNSGLVGSVRVSAAEVDKLGSAVKGAGTSASGASGDFDKASTSTDKFGSEADGATRSSGGLSGMLAKLKGRLTGTATEADKAGKEIGQASRETDKLGKSGSSTTSVMGGFSTVLGALGLSATVADLIRTNIEMENLRVSLTTVTGSAELADEAFAGIEAFAADSPSSVAEVTEAFIKLVALGLDPTEEALISYSNTAGAMGKDLEQMIEAVADASVGEFERLKEFGIKARVENENVVFSFRGMTTEIENSSAEIEQYLIDLGNTEFAGGMEAQNATLEASINRVGGAWNNLLDTMLSDEGSEGIQTMLDGIAAGINYLSTDVIDTFQIAFVSSIAAIENAFIELGGISEIVWASIEAYAQGAINIIMELMSDWLSLLAEGLEWLGADETAQGIQEFADSMAPATDAYDDLGKKIEDIVLKRSAEIEANNDAVLSVIAKIEEDNNQVGSLDDVAAALKKNIRANEDTTESVEDLTDATVDQKEELGALTGALDPAVIATEALEKKIGLLDQAFFDGKISAGFYDEMIGAVTTGHNKAIPSTEDLEKEIGRLDDAFFAGEISAEDYERQIAAVTTGEDDATTATGDLEAEIRRLEAAFFAGEISAGDFEKAVTALKTEHENATTAIEDETLAVQANAKEADAYAEAWGQALSRIDEAFADAWAGAFDSFDAFADQMVVAMEQLLAEMAHAAITQPIIMSMGMTGSVGSNYAGGAAGSSYTDPITGITSFFGGNTIGQGFASSGNYLASTTGIGAAPPGFVGPPGGGIFEGAAGIPNWQYGAYGLGGYFLGDTLFEGEYAGMGGSLGALGGAALGASYGAWGGPVGAGIGAIGGAAVGSLFGGDVPDPAIVMRGGVAGTLPTGQRTSVATGAFGDVSVGFHDTGGMDEQTAQDAAQAIADMVADVDNIIASTLDEAEFAAAEEAAQDFYRKVDDSAENLAETLIWRYTDMLNAIDENLGTIFSEGTDGLDAEEVAVYAASLALVQQGIESLTGAHDAYEIMIGGETQTLYDATKAQGDALAELILNYDGSYESTLILSGALQDRYGLEIMLIGEIEGVIQNVQTALGDTAEMIRIDQLSQTQRYTELSEEADALALSIEDMLDPTEINDAIIRIDEIINEMYSSLDPEGQAGIADSLILFLDETMATATQQLEIAKTELSKSSGAMAEGLATAIDDAGGNLSADIGDVAGMQAQAASDMQSAASGMDTAANTMLRAAQTPQTIVVQVEQQQAVGF